MRDVEFGAAPSVLGSSGSDENCAVWLAALIAAECIDCTNPIIVAAKARVLFLTGLLAIDFPERVKNFEALLQ